LLSVAEPSQRDELTVLLSRSGNHRRDALRPWLQKTDAIDYARQKAIAHTGHASEELAVLPQSPARDSLLGLTRFVVDRRH
jgi:geranylgeranyl pyrophosphate synthase